MPECAFRLCDIEFEIDPHRPGQKQKYCCHSHQKYENWHKTRERKEAKARLLKERQQRARIYAVSYCVKYRDCLRKIYHDDGAFNCHQCTIGEFKDQAFMDELEERTYDTDTYPLHLP